MISNVVSTPSADLLNNGTLSQSLVHNTKARGKITIIDLFTPKVIATEKSVVVSFSASFIGKGDGAICIIRSLKSDSLYCFVSTIPFAQLSTKHIDQLTSIVLSDSTTSSIKPSGLETIRKLNTRGGKIWKSCYLINIPSVAQIVESAASVFEQKVKAKVTDSSIGFRNGVSEFISVGKHQIAESFYNALKQLTVNHNNFNLASYCTDKTMRLWRHLYLSSSPTQAVATYRAQWLSTYPFFALHPLRSELDVLIDAGTNSLPTLTHHFRCSQALIKKLSPLALEVYPSTRNNVTGIVNGSLQEEIISFLRDVPVSKLPVFSNSTSDSSLIVDLIESGKRLFSGAAPEMLQLGLERLGKNQFDHHAGSLSGKKLSAKGSVKDFIYQISKATFLPYWIQEGKSIDNYHDMPKAAIASGTLGAHAASFNLVALALAKHCSVKKLAVRNNDWHKIIGNSNHANAGYLEWLPITEPLFAPNGLQLVPLNSSTELMDEGRLLKHCVGGYATLCAQSGTHIISVRSGNVRDSTLELYEPEIAGKHGVVIKQHRQHSNKKPSAAATEAANWYVQQINTNKIKVNFEHLRLHRQHAGSVAKVGFDPANSEIWLKVYKALEPFLPKQLQFGTPQAFVEASDLRQFESLIKI